MSSPVGVSRPMSPYPKQAQAGMIRRQAVRRQAAALGRPDTAAVTEGGRKSPRRQAVFSSPAEGWAAERSISGRGRCVSPSAATIKMRIRVASPKRSPADSRPLRTFGRSLRVLMAISSGWPFRVERPAQGAERPETGAQRAPSRSPLTGQIRGVAGGPDAAIWPLRRPTPHPATRRTPLPSPFPGARP